MKKTTACLACLLNLLFSPAHAQGDLPDCPPSEPTVSEGVLGHIFSLLQGASTELNIAPNLPDMQALRAWREVPGYVNYRIDLKKYPRLTVDCADKNLYPTHPQQSLKKYHLFDRAQYDNTKLKGESEACTIRPASGKNICLAATVGENVVVSDTFTDSCGHLYRGFKHVSFLKKDESMGTLFSPGRATFDNPKSEFAHDMLYDDTYSVDARDLLFLGPVLPGDKEAIASERKRAEETHTYHPDTHLYTQKK